jgi:AcrR family transcriptional regulator
MSATEAPGARERILSAALQIFSEKGFDGATTRDIAARAKVNLGLINYYFDTKLKLWRAAVDSAFSDLGKALTGARNDTSWIDEIALTRERLRRFVAFTAHHPELVRLMHDEAKRRGPRMRWLIDRHVRALYDEILRMLQLAQKRGLLPAHIDPLHFHYILIGATSLIFHHAEECRRLTGVDPMEENAIRAHADAVVHMLLGPEEAA